MHFDDRLATVLRQRGDSMSVCRSQYRQLIDLLGTMPSEASSPSIDAAIDRLNELGRVIPAAERAAILRDIALRLRNPRLVALLAGAEPQVARSAIGRAQLSEEQWLDLAPALPASGRAAIGDRRDLPASLSARLSQLGIARRMLPGALAEASSAPDTAPAIGHGTSVRNDSSESGIAAIVRRIEEYTRLRRTLDAEFISKAAPRLPLGEDDDHHDRLAAIQAFDFITDGDSRIVWAEPHLAPMLFGLRLNAADRAATVQIDTAIRLGLQRRQPIEAGLLTIDGAPAVAGNWQMDAVPCFDPVGGRFTGYRGRMRRPSERIIQTPPPDAVTSQGDQIRQLLHELRTPVNAIQGFGEVIQQQLFGPTPHEYRALAAGIVGDAARIMAGFDELERLAKLDTGAQSIDTGACDFAAVVSDTVDQLNSHMRARDCRFHWQPGHQLDLIALPPEETERLVWRLLAALANQSAPGEVLRIKPRMRGNAMRIKLDLPQALARLDDRDLFHAVASTNPQVISASMFGTGFALRLAASEARAAGGSLERHKDRLVLTLPGLTGPAANSSPDDQSSSAG